MNGQDAADVTRRAEGALPDGQVRLGDHRVYRVADHWEGVIAGHRVALLIPLPATPEEDDDGE